MAAAAAVPKQRTKVLCIPTWILNFSFGKTQDQLHNQNLPAALSDSKPCFSFLWPRSHPAEGLSPDGSTREVALGGWGHLKGTAWGTAQAALQSGQGLMKS